MVATRNLCHFSTQPTKQLQLSVSRAMRLVVKKNQCLNCMNFWLLLVTCRGVLHFFVVFFFMSWGVSSPPSSLPLVRAVVDLTLRHVRMGGGTGGVLCEEDFR